MALLVAGLACQGALACASLPASRTSEPGSVRGRVVAQAGASRRAPEPMLVFLEPLDPQPPGGSPLPAAVLRATDQGFAPPFLAARAGQSLRFQNDAKIYHHLFSYSESNPFDVGVLRHGDSKSLELRSPGVVRIYCRLHPGEGALLFVAPSDHFAVVEPPQAWEIQGVPPGRYRVRAWGETTSAHGNAITVTPGASVATEIAARRPAAAE